MYIYVVHNEDRTCQEERTVNLKVWQQGEILILNSVAHGNLCLNIKSDR